jgi:hypothetical protein
MNYFGPGIIIMLGFALLMIKLPLRMNLILLGHALILDILVTVLAYLLHWGTFTGVMAAAFAGLLCSVTTSSLRWAIGYIESRRYIAGKIWNMSPYLEKKI